MKPIALYQGGAPATLSQMGQGVAEGIGRVGELYAKGISGVSNAITSAIGEYAQKQQINKSANALQKFASTLPSEEGSVGQALQAYMSDPEISNLDKVRFGQSVIGDYFKNMLDLRRIQEANRGRMDLQGMRTSGGTTESSPISFSIPPLNPE
jgi:hypothetical protein